MFLTKKTFEDGFVESFENISAKMFKDQTDRTLMLGYDLERNTVHIYLQNGTMMVTSYNGNGLVNTHLEGEFKELQSIIPNKRAYPESTDFDFFNILKNTNTDVCFTNFDHKREEKLSGKNYHGLTIKDMVGGTRTLAKSQDQPLL